MQISTPVLLAASSGPPAWVTYLSLALAGLSAVGVFGNFVRTRHRDNREERRQYADQVSAWTGPRVHCPSSEDVHDWDYHFHSVVVHNGSAQPVYDVVVNVETEHEGETRTLNVAVGLVPPGDRVETDIGDVEQEEHQFAVPLAVHFTDAHGVRWYRDSAGKLQRFELEPDVGEGVGDSAED